MLAGNREVLCGGFQWEIYLHLNKGQERNLYALSVFPVRNCDDDALPDHIKLEYSVTASLLPRRFNSGPLTAPFRHQWTRQTEQVVPRSTDPFSVDDDEKEEEAPNDTSSIDCKFHLEPMSFSTEDLIGTYCEDEDDHFDLSVSIKTTFIQSPSA